MNKTAVAALALAGVALAVALVQPRNGTLSSAQETAFERVLRTGTLRCGYPVWTPSLTVDPNTKALSGYSYDITQAVGEKLGLKVDWVEETGWGTAEQGLITGRYDMVCADVCLDAQRTKAAWYSKPVSHNPNYVFVRKGDTRFKDDFEKLNDPSVKFAVLPNTILDYAVRERFPRAGRVSANDLHGDVDMIMMVTSRKADASVNLMVSLDQFNAKNPGQQVKAIGPALRNCHGAFMLPRGDVAMKHMIDSAITEIEMGDRLRNIMLKYEPDDRRYWRLSAPPYRE